jgi:hypothetical protein
MTTNKHIELPSSTRLMLAVLEQANPDPGADGTFILQNLGGPPETGTLFLDANPGELSQPVKFIYKQAGKAELKQGQPPNATYEAFFKAIEIPVPKSLLEIIYKMNEGQFLKLGLNDKGICVVPRSRRGDVLEYLGFSTD